MAMTTDETSELTVAVWLEDVRLNRQVVKAAQSLGYAVFHMTSNTGNLRRLPQRSILITDESWFEYDSPDPIVFATEFQPKRVMLHIVRQGNVDGAIKSIKAGACNVLEQPVDNSVLINNIRAAVDLEVGFTRRLRMFQQNHGKINSLNPTETAIFAGLIKGRTNKEIAKELRISLRSVEFARAQIMIKLDVTTLAQLITVVTSEQVRAAIGPLHEFDTLKSQYFA